MKSYIPFLAGVLGLGALGAAPVHADAPATQSASIRSGIDADRWHGSLAAAAQVFANRATQMARLMEHTDQYAAHAEDLRLLATRAEELQQAAKDGVSRERLYRTHFVAMKAAHKHLVHELHLSLRKRRDEQIGRDWYQLFQAWQTVNDRFQIEAFRGGLPSGGR